MKAEDRLTIRINGYAHSTKPFADITERLAAYEDKGLSPEEIKGLKAENERLKNENKELDLDKSKLTDIFADNSKAVEKVVLDLREKLEKAEKALDMFIKELAWADVQWAAAQTGMSEACGQPSTMAITMYRKRYDTLFNECKSAIEKRQAEAALKAKGEGE
jgi:SMC interacting uncharacterized protein involved in chromosome segregation